MSVKYTDELINLYQRKGETVDLVTADGSIDCQGNPAEQETMTNRLHLCEVYVALSLLSKGGCFVLKTFTFFESESVNLLYLLSCAFQEVSVHKPITSKCGNSEVYIVAMGYTPSPLIEDYIKLLRDQIGSSSRWMLFNREALPSKFLQLVYDCCFYFNAHQIKAIQRNIDLYENPSTRKKQMLELLKKMLVNKFGDIVQGQSIRPSERIVSRMLDWDKYVSPQSSFKWGEQITRKPLKERLQFLNERLDDAKDRFIKQFNLKEKLEEPYIVEEVQRNSKMDNKWNLRKGKSIPFAYISRLCNMIVMQIYVKYVREFTVTGKKYPVNLNDFKISDSLAVLKEATTEKVSEILKQKEITSNAIVIDEGNYVGPHPEVKSLQKVGGLIQNNILKKGDSIVLLNVPLFTRKQAGILSILKDLFIKTTFHIFMPKNTSLAFYPFIVLNHFNPEESQYHSINELNSFLKEEIESESDKNCIHEVVDIQSLVSGYLHAPLCIYNTAFALWNSSIMESCSHSDFLDA